MKTTKISLSLGPGVRFGNLTPAQRRALAHTCEQWARRLRSSSRSGGRPCIHNPAPDSPPSAKSDSPGIRPSRKQVPASLPGSNRARTIQVTNPRYALEKSPGVWRLTFAGAEAHLKEEKGLHYVAYLLANPEPIHCTDLAQRVFGHTIIQEASLSGDAEPTVRKIRAEAAEMVEIINDPFSTEDEKEEARTALESLARAQTAVTRRSVNAAEKTVRAVQQAVRRFLNKLHSSAGRQTRPEPVLKAFGDHLQKYLWVPSSRYCGVRRTRSVSGVAGVITYEPPKSLTWWVS
jgi:hypothetical protein